MMYRGKRICALIIKDGEEVIATICDEKEETTNGYTVEVVPYTEETKG